MRSERSRFSLVLIGEDPHVQRTASWILFEEGYYVAVCATVSLAAAQRAELSADAVLWDVGLRRDLDEEARVLRRAFPRETWDACARMRRAVRWLSERFVVGP